ncbi:gamma-glutamyl-gamma-aminobutyrate hydrolase family protein [Brevibacillus composti]|uniref:Gamma-glutamyl-gamma-aminobutyrate hydrolase family protein n=1 Tax=Brevibacillus composti TaxID=2796470 RepID=A0A7T5EI52_9BACL|nr:gamma-glutamyl-gamma-aminobutyrate hydrolase family protein [Brevibacillus composti]QQE72972.1 gamma-glutamyl-gamma-aminobutyrate hydrolase family protein [Brevibacillus composti]QUO40050.1 gamma-glutamyl-gamma-aminobutyrate hydrolase family protein [Brevibacillus composti]
MSRKPVIGITGAYIKHNAFSEGVYVHHDYHRSVAAAGGLPIVLPYLSPEIALETAGLVDGIILSGGEDVDPLYYGEEPHLHLGYTNPERDDVEIALANYAVERQIPLLAICRGVQILNVARGGTLIQDIPSQVKDPLQHAQKAERSRDTHWVTIESGSWLAEIFGTEQIRVNSLHHQALKDVGDDLKVVARASDGIIEAVEYTGSSFAVGVQWHPESQAASDPLMRRLFAAFVDCAKRRK